MTLNTLTGQIGSIVTDTWDGDNDGYTFTAPVGGTMHIVLDWEKEGGDYDATVYCEHADENNPYDIYTGMFEPSLADVSKPEGGVSVVPIYDTSRCWFFVVGYSGEATTYTVEIAVLSDSPGPLDRPVGDDDDSAGDDDDSAGDDDDSAGDDDDSAR